MANFVRLSGRLLQTPVHRFRHPQTGRHITMISVSHVGDPRYFRELRAVLDREDAAGAEIHVEGTKPVDRSSVSDDERAVLSRLDEARQLEIAAIGHLGWVHQLSAIGAYPDHWQSHDLNGVDILRASGGLEAMRKMAERQIKMFTLRNRRAVAWFRVKATLIHTVMATASSGAIDKASARGGHDDVLLNQRDELTLKALFATDRDVVLIWGGQHLLRLQVGIEAEGFELIDTTWQTVTRLPRTASLLWGLIRGR